MTNLEEFFRTLDCGTAIEMDIKYRDSDVLHCVIGYYWALQSDDKGGYQVMFTSVRGQGARSNPPPSSYREVNLAMVLDAYVVERKEAVPVSERKRK